MNSYLVILLLAGFLISTFFGVVFYMIVGKTKNKRLNDLKRSGKVIDAIITKIQNEAVINRPVVVCRIHENIILLIIRMIWIINKFSLLKILTCTCRRTALAILGSSFANEKQPVTAMIRTMSGPPLMTC